MPFRVRLLDPHERDRIDSAQHCEPITPLVSSISSHNSAANNLLTMEGMAEETSEGSDNADTTADDLLVALNYSTGPPYSFVVSYFLPGAFQAAPPAPLDSRLFVDPIAAHTVAVRRFTHSATNWLKVEQDMLTLEQQLDDAHIARCEAGAIVAMYDRRDLYSEVAFMLPDRPPIIDRRGSTPSLPTFPPTAPAAVNSSTDGDQDSATLQRPQSGEALDICNAYECPTFDSVGVSNSDSDEVLRNYSQSRWISVTQFVDPAEFHQVKTQPPC